MFIDLLKQWSGNRNSNRNRLMALKIDRTYIQFAYTILDNANIRIDNTADGKYNFKSSFTFKAGS